MSLKVLNAVLQARLPQSTVQPLAPGSKRETPVPPVSTSTKKLVLLALANHCHDDGTHAYPGIRRLAIETGASRRAVQNALHWLVEDKLIAVAQRGGGRGRATNFTLNVTKLLEMQDLRLSSRAPKTMHDVPSLPTERELETVHDVPSLAPGNIARRSRNIARRATPTSMNPLTQTPSPHPPQAGDPLYPIAKALSIVCGMDLTANKGRLFKAAMNLQGAEIRPTPQLIQEAYGASGWWYGYDWRGHKGDLPTPENICATWGQDRRARGKAILTDAERQAEFRRMAAEQET